jgi:three-Cys-motif partner protein
VLFRSETDEWLLGSTLIALETEPAFAKCLAIELRADDAAVLAQRAHAYGSRAVIVQGDANSELVGAMDREIPHRGPSFVLLDPEGTELEWSTVAGAARHRHGPRKSELLILFATEGVNRMLPVEAEIERHNEMALNRMFPPQADWRSVWLARRDGEFTPTEARLQYVEQYMLGLWALGYAAVLRREISRSSGGLVYHLVFATDHPTGERIMTSVFGSMHSNRPQLQLF